MSTPDRRELVDRQHGRLSVRRQCRLLGLARSGVYRPALPGDDNDLAVMRRLDELFTAWPFLGSRRMAQMLKEEGYAINRKRAQRLIKLSLLQEATAKLGDGLWRKSDDDRHLTLKITPLAFDVLGLDLPNDTSMVLDSRQASTARDAQSMIATR